MYETRSLYTVHLTGTVCTLKVMVGANKPAILGHLFQACYIALIKGEYVQLVWYTTQF